MKKFIILILIAMLFVAACGKKKTVKSDATNVVFWHAMGGPLGVALDKLVTEFNASRSDIHITAINMGNYQALSQKLMAAIQTGNQPDIAQVFEAWTANMMKGNKEIILPLDNMIKNDPNFTDEDLKDFFPVFIKSNTIGGKIMSLPFNKSVSVLYYNKDMFFKNKLDFTKPPKTWDEFRSVCKKLTKDTDGDGKPEHWGFNMNISAWQFENLLVEAGGEIMDSTFTKPLFNSKAGVKALNYITTLLNKDKTAYLSTGYEGQNDFLAGKVAMYQSSSVSMAFMKKTGIDFNIGVAAIPGDKTKKNIISGTNVAIFKSKDEKVQKAAWEFMKWFTNTKQTAKWSEMTYYMPVRKSAFNEPEIKNRLASNPETASVYDQLNYAVWEPQISEWFETRKYLEDHVIEKVIRGGGNPKKALDNAAEMLRKKLKENKK